MSRIYRIKDIATLSGVSTGTVDRILHKRGRVSEEARIKVEKVLKEIDYQPNILARSLALKKHFKIAALIPSYFEGSYWHEVHKGIEKAQRGLYSYQLNVEEFCYNQYAESSFAALIPTITSANFNGVIIAASFKDLTMELTAALDKDSIPYIFIDSSIEGTNALSYYGTNRYMSGYTAGRLMLQSININKDIAMFLFHQKESAEHSSVGSREEGFIAYLNENNYTGKIHTIYLKSNDETYNANTLDSFFLQYPNTEGGAIFNSSAHQIANYIESNREKVAKEFSLIGYDAIAANSHYVKNGIISYLIAQRPEVQGINCVRSLFKHMLLQEHIESINYMPIDILMKENIDYYNNYI